MIPSVQERELECGQGSETSQKNNRETRTRKEKLKEEIFFFRFGKVKSKE